MRVTWKSPSAPRASIFNEGFFSMFLYHCVSEPFTGSRLTLPSSKTNHTGLEWVWPDLRPVKLTVISWYRDRRSDRSSFLAGICLLLHETLRCGRAL